MDTILDALDFQASRPGDPVFCHFLKARRAETITYARLYHQAGRYAGLFQEQGLTPGEVVLIMLPHTPDLYFAFLGAMLAGLVPAFMPLLTAKQDPRLYWESHRTLFARLGAGALLTSPEQVTNLRSHLPSLALKILTSADAERGSGPCPRTAPGPADTALLQHSSGTTGLKKGVALSHRAVLDQVASYTTALNLSPADKIVSWLPLYHDMGLIACFLLPLITGTPLVQLDPFEWAMSPQLLFEAVSQYRPTLAWMPNFAFAHLCRSVKRAGSYDLSSMRAWINCSEPCRAETFSSFSQQFGGAGVTVEQLQTCYAMAETVFAVTQSPLGVPVRWWPLQAEPTGRARLTGARPGQSPAGYLSAGEAISSLQFKIVDEQGKAVGDNCLGEIAVSGSCLFSGYYQQPEETGKKLQAGWYFTGDLGFCSQGHLVITGRKHDLIIVHGRNFYAHEMEFAVNQLPGVKPGRVVATGYYLPEIGSEEMVIIAEAENRSVSAENLKTEIKQCLLDTSGLLPYDVRIVPPGWLVKTTSGKISRGANLEKYLSEAMALSR